MAEYLQAYKLTIASEGGYTCDPNDSGGETYLGISRNNFPTWAGWPMLDKLKPLKHGQIVPAAEVESAARTFYRQNFWDKMAGDAINSQKVADAIFDWHVNAGGAALKAIQRVIGLSPDANYGPITVAAINGKDEATLLLTINHARKSFYYAIVAKHPADKVFLNGWLARADRFFT